MAVATYNTHVNHANQKVARLPMVSPFQAHLLSMTEALIFLLQPSDKSCNAKKPRTILFYSTRYVVLLEVGKRAPLRDHGHPLAVSCLSAKSRHHCCFQRLVWASVMENGAASTVPGPPAISM